MVNFLKKDTKKTNRQIVCIPDSLKARCKGKKDFKAGVLEFLNYIFYADHVITDSFHATAFSIIFEKQFNIIMKQKWKSLNGRMEALAEKYKLEKNVIWNESDIDKLGNNTEYQEIREKVKKEVQESREFIVKSLG